MNRPANESSLLWKCYDFERKALNFKRLREDNKMFK